jgi:hypothetical protein
MISIIDAPHNLSPAGYDSQQSVGTPLAAWGINLTRPGGGGRLKLMTSHWCAGRRIDCPRSHQSDFDMQQRRKFRLFPSCQTTEA